MVSRMIVLTSFISMAHKLESSEKQEHQLRRYPLEISLCATLWGIFFFDDPCGRTHITLGDAIPELVVPVAIRKPTEQFMGSTPVSSTPPRPSTRSCL